MFKYINVNKMDSYIFSERFDRVNENSDFGHVRDDAIISAGDITLPIS